ncbi:recombinase family protein [Listeria monocytogenes]|uniref:Transposon Tn3 resolvase n=1 Tax=Listeria monocytogenes TaxID=1639 RepID=A0AB37NFX0_LISMN|nr:MULTISPECIES: recombinase family protein [Listeria]ADB69777.1 resolvase [Listeria monocytogenes 08-5578]EAE3838900.1 recombinase family protein [Listeria monocytogenes serotype 1/2b]EXL25282.1 resolvase [Listeria monocytogenes Lm_1880]EZH69186.1 resolvase [Listeria monocytogenes N53-1]KHK05000.1 putative resolvase [Listeria monocytogenes SHL002]KHK19126.1 putative resolvase [Listeria monocytogenes SHL008]UCK61968.1 serine recombinase family protein [Listeria grayi]ULG20194.1 recombinase 
MKLGYARVSTVGQDLQTQIEKLKNAGITDDYLFIEKKSGTTTRNRHELENLLKQARNGDHVFVTKIDRLARSIIDLNNVMNRFKEKGVSVTFLDNNMTFEADTENNAMQRLLFNVLGSFAEFERDMIVNRTGEGRQRAKAAGKKLGRTGQPEEKIRRAIAMWKNRKQLDVSISEIVEDTGVPRATLYKKIKEMEKENEK